VSKCMYCGSSAYGIGCPFSPNKLHVHVPEFSITPPPQKEEEEESSFDRDFAYVNNNRPDSIPEDIYIIGSSDKYRMLHPLSIWQKFQNNHPDFIGTIFVLMLICGIVYGLIKFLQYNG